MRPNLPRNNSVDGAETNGIVFCDFLAGLSRCMSRTNNRHIGFRDLNPGVSLASRGQRGIDFQRTYLSPFLHHIRCVLRVGSKPQVMRAHARRVIATMQDEEIDGNLSEHKCIDYTADSVALFIAHNATVSPTRSGSLKFPAFSNHLHTLRDSILKLYGEIERNKIWRIHVSLHERLTSSRAVGSLIAV